MLIGACGRTMEQKYGGKGIKAIPLYRFCAGNGQLVQIAEICTHVIAAIIDAGHPRRVYTC